MYALTPLTLIHLVSRGFNQREYFQRWERTLRNVSRSGQGAVYLVARSIGRRSERHHAIYSNVCVTIIRIRLLLITTTTPTGSARVKSLFGDQGAACLFAL